MVKVVSHKKEILGRYQKAFKATAEDFDTAMTTVIREPRDWPSGFGTTIRRGSGETVVGSYRNIVDYGNLRDSQLMSVEQFKAIYSWNGMGETPAAIVFFGATLRNGTQIPPRDWVSMALSEINLSERFKDNLE